MQVNQNLNQNYLKNYSPFNNKQIKHGFTTTISRPYGTTSNWYG